MAFSNTPTGKNTVRMQLENRSTLLKLLRQNNHICRKDLAELSGLTGAAVTNLIRDLIQAGLVSEDRNYSGQLNRNAVSLKINFERFYVVGVSLRRGRLSYGVSDLSGKLLDKQSILLELDEKVDEILTTLWESVAEYINDPLYKGKIVGIGISVPGPINLEKGEISYLTNMPGWKAIPIKKFLEERSSLPVILDDAANAAALAEKWFGCGREYHNIISILVSKGVGAGIILNDQIYHGAFGFAGQVGHVSLDVNGPLCGCGNRGCLELYCSTLALVKKAQDIYGYDLVSGFNIIRERVAEGDKKLSELVVESGKYLGYAIVNLANAFNPELVVINGDMTDFGAIWFDSVKKAVAERLLPEAAAKLKIESSTLTDSPILLGTVAMVCEYIFEQPYLESFIKDNETIVS